MCALNEVKGMKLDMRINAFKAHLKYSNEKSMDKLLSNLDKNE
jgi:hypothetical protein